MCEEKETTKLSASRFTLFIARSSVTTDVQDVVSLSEVELGRRGLDLGIPKEVVIENDVHGHFYY
jgi:hypothetical protein